VEEFVFVDVIPRTASGKVLRRELKAADASTSAAR
jgi:acyl-coenzyme A synthetase/AMP-(fatty) acid ligase